MVTGQFLMRLGSRGKMKNRNVSHFLFLFSLTLIFNPSVLLSQSWNWVKAEAEYADPSPMHQEHINAADDSGNIYFTGSAWGVSIAKYDQNGSFLWENIPSYLFGTARSHSVALSLGDVYITGEYTGTIAFGNDTLLPASSQTMFLVKYNSGGIIMWVIGSGGTAKTFGETDIADATGNVFVGGDFTGNLILGKDTLSSPYQGIFLVKYDQNGNYLWSKAGISPQSTDVNNVYSVASDSLGDAFICGYYTGNIIFGTDTLPTTLSSHSNAFAIKYDANGNLIWLWTPNISNCYNEAYSIAADKVGDVFISGEFNSGNFTTGSITLNPIPSVYNPFFLKISANGNVGWVKQAIDLNGSSWVASSITVDNLYNIYMLLNGVRVNSFKLTIGSDTFKMSRFPLADVLLELDSAGNEKCGSIFTEGSENDGDGMNVSPAGQYVYVMGDVEPKGIFGNDSLSGSDTLFIASWQPCNSTETGIFKKNKSEELNIFPNPNNGSFTLSLSNVNEKCSFDVYNVLGERIYQSKVNSKSAPIDLSRQPQGIYFYRVLNENGKLIGNGKLIIEK